MTINELFVLLCLCIPSLVLSWELRKQNAIAPESPSIQEELEVEVHAAFVDYEDEDVHHDETLFWGTVVGGNDEELFEIPDAIADKYEKELLGDGGPVFMSIPGGSVPKLKPIVVGPSSDTLDLQIVVPENAEVKFHKSPTKGPPRRLSSAGLVKIGTSRVLLIRVISTDSEPTLTQPELTLRAFGAGPTLQGQYSSCSFGKLNLIPATKAGSDIVGGVGSVNLSFGTNGLSSSAVEHEAAREAQVKYGGSSTYDHIMLCLPPGTNDNWIAYGYLNFGRTVFNDLWCGSMSALIHELGHNIGLYHSNEITIYQDQTCLLGFSYNWEFGPRMCFNGHKNWVLGWYDNRKLIINPWVIGPWVGYLVAFVDYEQANWGEFVILNVQDYYIQYNKAKSFNVNVLERPDQVTIVQAPGPNDISELRGGLKGGEKFIAGDLIIELCHVFTGTKDFVEVSIYTSFQTSLCSGPTNPPTPMPTSKPTRMPTPVPTTRTPSAFPTVSVMPTVFGTEIPTPSPSSAPSEPIPTPAPSATPTGTPTITPTESPTASPTTSVPSAAPTSVPSVSPTNSPSRIPSFDVCDDNPYRSFWVSFLPGWQRCIWLAARPNIQTVLCDPNHESGAYDICEETCGKCTDNCEDDTTGRVNIDGVRRDCLYLSLRPHLIEQECHVGTESWDVCRETCRNCWEGPSAAPTPKPTTAVPTRTSAPSKVFTLDPCDDDPNFTFFVEDLDKSQSCIWLASRPDRQAVFCVEGHQSGAYDGCEETCQKCTDFCEDDPSAIFAYNNAMRDCEWFSIRPFDTAVVCVEGTEAWEACRETCGNCPPPPTTSPVPSVSPSGQTPAPTTQSPTAAPVIATPRPVVDYPPCNVCGIPGARISNPDALTTLPGVDPITCAVFQFWGDSGLISPELCPAIFTYAASCGCQIVSTNRPTTAAPVTLTPSTSPPVAPVTPAPLLFPTIAPTTLAPALPVTMAPVTLAPVTSPPVKATPAPFSGWLPCHICGLQSSEITNPDAVVQVPDEFPVTCGVLVSVGKQALIDPSLCQILPQYTVSTCGCTGQTAPPATAAPSVPDASGTPAPVVATMAPVTSAPVSPAPMEPSQQVTPSPNTDSPTWFVTPSPNTGHRPCNICGPRESRITILDGIVELPGSPALTCSVLQNIGDQGFIFPDICAEAPLYATVPCGCSGSPAAPVTPAPITPAPIDTSPPSGSPSFPFITPSPNTGWLPCNVCGMDESRITDTAALVTIPNFPRMTCENAQSIGDLGLISPDDCPNIPSLVAFPCRCTGVNFPPTAAPITAAPVTAAPSPAPIATASPITGWLPCNICGDDDWYITAPLQMVTLTGQQTLQCSELDDIGKQGLIDPALCETIPSQAGPCGCTKSTPAPVTPAPVTPAPVTPAPVTPAPVTPSPSLSPVTPAPVTPAPVTPAPVTPAPVTPAPIAPIPRTPAPISGWAPCPICGTWSSRITILDTLVSVPGEATLTCSFLQTLGERGQISPEVCPTVPQYVIRDCGCITAVPSLAPITPAPVTPAPVYTPFPHTGLPPCFVCGSPEFEVTLGSNFVSVPGEPILPCSVLDTIGRQGLITAEVCEIVPEFAIEACGCALPQQPSATPSDVPSMFPSVNPTTTPTQTPSTFPSADPSAGPSAVRSDIPTDTPSIVPSVYPSEFPTQSDNPSDIQSDPPSGNPTTVPLPTMSNPPSIIDSVAPSVPPSMAPTTTNATCNVCGADGGWVTAITATVTVPGRPPTTCLALQNLGNDGLIDTEVCTTLPAYTNTTCACAFGTGTSLPQPSPAPVAPRVTTSPVAPVPLHYKAYALCDICGEDDEYISNTQVMVQVPGFDGPVSCGALQMRAHRGLIHPSICAQLPSLVSGDCGCAR